MDKDSDTLNQRQEIDATDADDIWLQSSYTLRKLIGVAGMLLPLLLWTSLWITDDVGGVLPSISHYFFTRSASIFVATLSLIAIFLMVYNGKQSADFYISSGAGLCAFLVILAPTDNLANSCCSEDLRHAITFIETQYEGGRVVLHYAAAALFFMSLAYMSFFLFTKSKHHVASRPRNKKIRNRIYRTCGLIIVMALLVIFVHYEMSSDPNSWYYQHQLTFWMETLAIEAFGFSWLVKGDTLFKDS